MSNRQIPALRFGYTVPDDPEVVAVLFQYRAVNSDRIFHAIDRNLDGEMIVSEGIFGGQLYEVRAAVETVPPRSLAYGQWIRTAGQSEFPSVELKQWREDAIAAISRHANQLQRFHQLIDELTSAQQATALDENIRRRELATRTDNTEALIVEEQQVRATADAALASDITLLSASVGDNAAAIVQEAVTRANAITAEAAARTAAIAEIDTEIAEGLFDIQAVAAPGGVEVRLAMLARASDGDSFKESGIFIDVISDGLGGFNSTVTIKADSFRVTDSNDDLIFGTFAGEFISNAVSRSLDGKFRLNPPAGQLLISD